METKPLLFGLIGFFLGGLLVSVAATTFDRPAMGNAPDMSMAQMTESLQGKKGEEFDKAFIAGMIEHHEGAVAMAQLSRNQAKHEEIKRLSQDIISAQKAEITEMKRWQSAWGYPTDEVMHTEKGMH